MIRTALALLTSVVLVGTAGAAVATPAAPAAPAPGAYALSPQARGHDIAAGGSELEGTHTLVVDASGVPYAAGDNNNGQLGAGTTTESDTLIPMTGLPGGITADSVAAGPETSIVIGSDGIPYATGSNDYGQLGDGTLDDHDTLTPMTGLPSGVTAVAVAAGKFHTVVLGSDRIPYATGWNGQGQLGDGTLDAHDTLMPMTGLPSGVTAVAVASGKFHTVVLGSDGIPYATGWNAWGQLGNGTTDVSDTLTPMVGLPAGITATGVAAGRDHSVVVGSDGIAYATGSNALGQLGDYTSVVGWRPFLGPMLGMPTGVSVTSVAAGTLHTMVRGSDGDAYAAGVNDWGQIGDDTNINRGRLTRMLGLPPGVAVRDIAAGGIDSLVRAGDGLVYGAGDNSEGQLTTSASNPQRTLALLAGQTWSNLSTPTIRGKARVDSRIRVSKVTWSIPPGTLSYKWIRDGSPIKGATGTTYTPRPRDLGDRVKVRITAEHVGLEPITVTTRAVRVAKGLAPRYIAKRKPVLKGKAKVGKKLRLNHFKARAFSPRPTKVRIQWLRNGKVIKGAHAKRYRIKRADRGKKIRVRIKAMLKGHRPGKVQTKRVRVR